MIDKPTDNQYPIHDLLRQRWSPLDFSNRLVEQELLCSVLEAARWAASSYNEQPWSFIIVTMVRSVVLVLYVRASRHVPVAIANLKLYFASYAPSTSLWLLSIAVPEATRYVLWAIGMTIELVLCPLLAHDSSLELPYIHRICQSDLVY